MNLSDEDFELLDRYLDNDLSEAELVGFEARLTTDRALAVELASLREFRNLRVEAMASLEATETESQQLQWRVRGAIHQQMRQPAATGWGDRAGGAVRGLSRIAAVLLIGMVVGYFYRGGSNFIPAPTAQNGASIVLPPVNAAGDAGPIQAVSNDLGPRTGPYTVALTDQFGNIIATQSFNSMQEAKDFATDVNRWQKKHRQVQSTGVRLIGDDF